MLDPTEVSPADGMTGCLIVPKWDEGHAKIDWNKNDPKDVETAREAFVKLKAKGHAAYRVDPKSNDRGELLKDFDPNAEKIIMVPQVVGG